MTNDLFTPTTDAALRSLDPAARLNDNDTARADDLLTSILATDPNNSIGSTGQALPPAPSRHRPTRWIAAAAAVGVLTTGGLAASTLGAAPAYASWTAKPALASEADIEAVAAACQAKAGTLGGGSAGSQGVPSVPTVDATDLSVRLGERRGDWLYVLLTTRTADRYDWALSCLAELPEGSEAEPQNLDYTTSGGGAFRETASGNQFTQGSISQFGPEVGLLHSLFGGPSETVSVTEGTVSPDIVGVTIHSQGATVEASVKDGTYAAWWPGEALTDERPPSGEGGPRPTITYDVTMKDGRVLTNVAPWLPNA